MPFHKLSSGYPCVAKLGSLNSPSFLVVRLIAGSVPYLESRPIPTSDLLYPAFSGISIQRIREPTVLPERDDLFWGIKSRSDATAVIIRQKIDNTQIPKNLRSHTKQGGRPRGEGMEKGEEVKRENAEIVIESK